MTEAQFKSERRKWALATLASRIAAGFEPGRYSTPEAREDFVVAPALEMAEAILRRVGL